MLRLRALHGLLIVAIASCAPIAIEPPPPDGLMVVRAQQGTIRAVAPPAVRGRSHHGNDHQMAVGIELEPGHTVLAAMAGGIGNPAEWVRATSGLSKEERLRLYVDEVEMVERAVPGRRGAILRSWEHLGDALPPHAALGIACEQHQFVSEDRQIPGQIGKAFVYHQRTYSCIDPRSGFPVELAYSERFPEATATLRPEFINEAKSFFSSLRFE
jgi:hypothetical protein